MTATSSAANAEGSAIGFTEPIATIALGMPVSGQVEELNVVEGSFVTADEIVLVLDREIEDLDRQSKQLLFDNWSAVFEAEQRVQTLNAQVKAARSLSSLGAVSRKQLEDEEIAYFTAQAQLSALKTAKAREEIDLALAEVNYERRQLRAPRDGIITRVEVEVGETVPAQQPVLELVDVSKIRFRGTFSVADSLRFFPGKLADLRVVQYGQTIMRPARVTYVAPVADASSGLIDVIAEVDNGDSAVLPGTTAELLLRR